MKRKVISRVSAFLLTFSTKIKFQHISRIPIVSKHHLRSNHENLVDCRIELGRGGGTLSCTRKEVRFEMTSETFERGIPSITNLDERKSVWKSISPKIGWRDYARDGVEKERRNQNDAFFNEYWLNYLFIAVLFYEAPAKPTQPITVPVCCKRERWLTQP